MARDRMKVGRVLRALMEYGTKVGGGGFACTSALESHLLERGIRSPELARLHNLGLITLDEDHHPPLIWMEVPIEAQPFRAAPSHEMRERNKVRATREKLVNAVAERDGWACAYCPAPPPYHLDHVTPLAKGGTSEVENLQLLCPECNYRKGGK